MNREKLVRAGAAAVFEVLVVSACDLRKKPITNEIYPSWNRDNRILPIGTTIYNQVQVFSRGEKFNEPAPAYFPFIVTIPNDTQHILREKLAPIIPKSLILEIQARGSSVTSTDRVPDPDNKKYAIGISFDEIAKNVLVNSFSQNSLSTDESKEEFAQKVQEELFVWMLTELHYFSMLVKAKNEGREIDLENTYRLAQKLGIDYARQMSSEQPIRIKADPRVNYRGHYKIL